MSVGVARATPNGHPAPSRLDLVAPVVAGDRLDELQLGPLLGGGHPRLPGDLREAAVGGDRDVRVAALFRDRVGPEVSRLKEYG
jgi:hypothetical protein